jgi:hypothetical protein
VRLNSQHDFSHIANRRLEEDVAQLDQRVYDLETSYFEETAGYNVVNGWNGFPKWVLGLGRGRGISGRRALQEPPFPHAHTPPPTLPPTLPPTTLRPAESPSP